MNPSNLVLLLFGVVAIVMGTLTWLATVLYRRTKRARALALVAGNLAILATIVGVLLFGAELYYRFVFDDTDGFEIT